MSLGIKLFYGVRANVRSAYTAEEYIDHPAYKDEGHFHYSSQACNMLRDRTTGYESIRQTIEGFLDNISATELVDKDYKNNSTGIYADIINGKLVIFGLGGGNFGGSLFGIDSFDQLIPEDQEIITKRPDRLHICKFTCPIKAAFSEEAFSKYWEEDFEKASTTVELPEIARDIIPAKYREKTLQQVEDNFEAILRSLGSEKYQ